MTRLSSAFLPILVSLAVLSCAAPASASDQVPTETEQRFACMGDALRLCPQFVPDREAIRKCMAAQRDALSQRCRPVFDASMKAVERLPAARR